tara:strand:+ start:1759 stop:1959 length:201 start_codon:yes stop_codon:yes gene_type:complete
MDTGAIIVFIILGLFWVWIVYEMYMAPEVDNEGNIIYKDDLKIDITEEDINEDLNCMYGQDKEEIL